MDVQGQELHDKSKHADLNGMGPDRTGTRRIFERGRCIFFNSADHRHSKLLLPQQDHFTHF